MISVQELDSLPLSEAPPDSVSTKLKPKREAASLPDWKYCKEHEMWFLFECLRCNGELIHYGEL